MSFLLAQMGETAPDSKGLLMICLVPTILGALMFHFLNIRDKADLGYRIRLIALAPILIGVIWGGVLSYRMATDYAYQQFHLIGGMRAALHYAALGFNLVGMAGIIVWNARSSKGPKYDF